MNSAVLSVVCGITILCEYAVSLPAKYDQRQEGELNVRTDVEDVLFVVVPPQDLVTAGMGLVAATAADLLRKNYGGIGPERWPLKAPTKMGFVPLEKSPYKVDLEKSGLKVKKVPHVGDPNRYNFHENKNPVKAAVETKTPVTVEIPEKVVSEMVTEASEEAPSTTESKTVKKVLKPEEMKKPIVEEEKKKEKVGAEGIMKTEETKTKAAEKADKVEKVVEQVKVIGEGSKDGLDPTSILRIEGCGPDGRRDSSGKCVFKS